MGVLRGVFVLKSGLRILNPAPEVLFSVPPKTPKMGHFGRFGGTENGTSITHNLAMLWTVTGVSDNFLIFWAALMIYACFIRNFSYSLKKSGLWGKYFLALVASPRCDRCGRAGRTMLAGKELHYHRKSSIITTQLKKRFIQKQKPDTIKLR